MAITLYFECMQIERILKLQSFKQEIREIIKTTKEKKKYKKIHERDIQNI